MQTYSLSQLNLLALPSLDLLTPYGWGVVSELPSEPGCYVCVCSVAKRRTLPHRHPVKQRAMVNAAVDILGDRAREVVAITEQGKIANVLLYIGYSKDLWNRWNGRSEHHKQGDLMLMCNLMNAAFDVRSFRLHWMLARSGQDAKAIEDRLIPLWNPILNGRKPLIPPPPKPVALH